MKEILRNLPFTKSRLPFTKSRLIVKWYGDFEAKRRRQAFSFSRASCHVASVSETHKLENVLVVGTRVCSGDGLPSATLGSQQVEVLGQVIH